MNVPTISKPWMILIYQWVSLPNLSKISTHLLFNNFTTIFFPFYCIFPKINNIIGFLFSFFKWIKYLGSYLIYYVYKCMWIHFYKVDVQVCAHNIFQKFDIFISLHLFHLNPQLYSITCFQFLTWWRLLHMQTQWFQCSQSMSRQ